MNDVLKKLGQKALLSLGAGATVLIILEFVLHRHGKISFEDLPLFPAIFGLVGAVIVVVAGKVLKQVLSRGEAYYDDE